MLDLATKRTFIPSNPLELCLYISLIRRFALLRQTAFPALLPAINATRPEWPCSIALLFRSCWLPSSTISIAY